MTYPFGTPSTVLGTGVFSSDFSPTVVVGGIINNYTPVSNIGMRNSIGYQISLLQNFVSQERLGLEDTVIDTAWLQNIRSTETMSGTYNMDLRTLTSSGHVTVNDLLVLQHDDNSDVHFGRNCYYNGSEWLRINSSDENAGRISFLSGGAGPTIECHVSSNTSDPIAWTEVFEAIIDDGAFNIRQNLTVYGTTSYSNNVSAGNYNYRGGNASIADNGVTSFTPGKSGGQILLRWSYGGGVDGGSVLYDVTLSACEIIAQYGSTIEVTTGILTGTTGNDGVVTVSTQSASGKIYIENRLGGTITFSYTLIGE